MYSLKEDIKSALECGSLKWKIKELYWAFYYAFSRAVRGYDDREVFEFEHMLTRRMYKLLGIFKKHNVGLFVEHKPKVRELNEEETDAVIDKLREYLEYIGDEERELVEGENFVKITETDGHDAAMEYIKMCNGKYQRAINDYFALLSEYYQQLWY